MKRLRKQATQTPKRKKHHHHHHCEKPAPHELQSLIKRLINVCDSLRKFVSKTKD